VSRLRGAGWVVALWTVFLLVYTIGVIPGAAQECEGAGDLGMSCPEVIGILFLVVFAILWLLGVVFVLFTRPDGVMRWLFVRVVVSTLALIGTLLLLSLVRLPGGQGPSSGDVPLLEIEGGLLVVGLLFAVVNSVVRPVLFAVFGRLILRSMGLAVVLVNFVLFWLVSELSRLAGDPWSTPEPRILWLFFDSLVFTVVLAVLDAFLGLDRPTLEPTSDSRIWRTLDALPGQRRNAIIESLRLQEVYATVSSYGLEIAFGGTPLAGVRRMGDRMRGRSSAALEAMSTPAKVRLMLQQLGPTYVKLGQMVSSRADTLPDEWRAELDKLQNTVPPFPWEQAKAIITHELGEEPETLFGSIETEPLAAASLAQVHRATLMDGTEVVIKVQRPDVQAKVRADLGVIQELAGVAESRLALARQVDASGLVREFADGVLEELDYTIEAYHVRRLADVIEGIEGVAVPGIHPDLSSARVLTIDFVPGVKATHADRLDADVDREAVARAFMRAMVQQVMVEGFFHADPHPGNVLVDTHTGVLTFLDLGLIGELRQEQRFDLLALLWALRSEDPGALASVSLRLCVQAGPLDESAYRADVERLFYRYWRYGGASFSKMMGALFGTLQRNGLRMRRELTLAVKAMTQAEELLRALAPGLRLVPAATEAAETQLKAQLTPERVAALIEGQLGSVVQEALDTATEQGGQIGPLILGMITGGRLGRTRPAPAPGEELLAARLDELGRRVDAVGRRLSGALLATGLAVGVSLVLVALMLAPGLELDGLVLVVAVLSGVVLAWLALRSWRTQEDATP
jgi:ubiquinone biosynthesis protein